MNQAIYMPDNRDLERVLANLPANLRRYADHARMLLHSICVKRWVGDLDRAGWARLSGEVLRQYIPDRVIRPLKDFLIGAGTIETASYSAGRYSTGYRVASPFDGPPLRVPLHNPALIRKRRAWRESFGRDNGPELAAVIEGRREVLARMRATLDRLTLAEPRDLIECKLSRAGANRDHVRYVSSVIEHGDHDGIIVDPFGFRVHTIVTRMAAQLRPFLRIGGDTLTELDVANAQPLILAGALLNPSQCATYIAHAQDIGRGGGACPVLDGVPSAEAEGFTRLCEKGRLYEFLLEKGDFADRETVKRLLYRDVLFGKPHIRGRMTDVFGQHWPGLLEGIQALKRGHGHKALAMLLQRLESGIVINRICGRIVRQLPDLDFLTVHDSTLVTASRGDEVRGLIVEEFARYGLIATVRQKVLGEKTAKGHIFT